MIRHLFLVPGMTVLLAACADTSGPADPADVEGEYQLVELEGEPVPYDRPNGCCIYTDGSLTLEAGQYQLSIDFRNKNNGMVGTSAEFGTYSVTNCSISFNWGGGDFHHRLYDAQVEGSTITLYLGGDAPGAADQFRAVFRK